MRKIVYVSDFFSNQLVGGAELSLQTLIDASPFEAIKINSADIDRSVIDQHKDCIWVFGNYTNLKYTLLPYIAENLIYTVIEFDYKFCKYRNPQMHLHFEGSLCDCHKTFGKRIEHFYKNAKCTFWMSELQREIFFNHFPALKESKNVILSSIFSDETLDFIKELRHKEQWKPRSGEWIVTAHDSWVKGFKSSIKYCLENSIKHRIVYSVAYKDLLRILSTAEGLVYMPNGEDTCPRLVIEAKLLGCKLILNDFVQHKNEYWFNGENTEELDIFLRYRKFIFNSVIKEIHDQQEIAV